MTSKEEKFKKNWSKYVALFAICLLVRLIPFRAPNIEPVMTVTMPFSKVYGGYVTAIFAFLSIVIYDLLTAGIGSWTWMAAFSYGAVGLWAASYFKNRESTRTNYVKFAVISTIAFDVVTGFLTGPLFFNQPIMVAIVGQIPFTLLHLLGNIAFAIFLSPAIYSFAVRKKKHRDKAIPTTLILNPKII